MADPSRIRLPARPLNVKPPGQGFGAMLKMAAMMAILAGFLAMLVTSAGPELAADAALLEAPLTPAAGGRMTEGHCQTRLFVVFCDIDLTADGADAGALAPSSFLLFLGAPRQTYEFTVLADPADPGRLTTTLALEKFWNRLATFGILALLGAVLILGGGCRLLDDWFHGRALIRAFRERPARPVALVLRHRNRWGWQVSATGIENRPGKRNWRATRKDVPVVLDGRNGIILGATPDGIHILPADAHGRFLGLDSNEAIALLASVADYQRHG